MEGGLVVIVLLRERVLVLFMVRFFIRVVCVVNEFISILKISVYRGIFILGLIIFIVCYFIVLFEYLFVVVYFMFVFRFVIMDFEIN